MMIFKNSKLENVLFMIMRMVIRMMMVVIMMLSLLVILNVNFDAEVN